MDKQELVNAYRQMKTEEDARNMFLFELFIMSVILGFKYKSWYVGIWSFLVLLILCCIKTITLIMGVFFTIMWGALGWGIGHAIDGIYAAILGAVIATLIGFGIHASLFSYTKN